MSTNSTYTLPSAEVASLPSGANSPAQAAYITQQQNNQYQSNLAKMGGKTWKRSKKGGVSNGVAIYTPTVPYNEVSTGKDSISSINQNSTQTLVQAQAYSVDDKYAAAKGGSRRRRVKTRKNKKSRKTRSRRRKISRRNKSKRY